MGMYVDETSKEVEFAASVHDHIATAWWVVAFVNLLDATIIIDFQADWKNQGLGGNEEDVGDDFGHRIQGLQMGEEIEKRNQRETD